MEESPELKGISADVEYGSRKKVVGSQQSHLSGSQSRCISLCSMHNNFGYVKQVRITPYFTVQKDIVTFLNVPLKHSTELWMPYFQTDFQYSNITGRGSEKNNKRALVIDRSMVHSCKKATS